MKTKNLFMTVLLAMLLLPTGVNAQVAQDVIIGDFMFDLFWQKTTGPSQGHARYAVVKAYGGSSGVMNIPRTVKYTYNDTENTYFVTTIADDAFASKTNITSVTIPNELETIGQGAFSGCSSLTTVTFTSTSKVSRIKQSAFLGCTSLTSITIPQSVTTLGTSAFKNCTSLSGFSFYDGGHSSLTSIPNNVLENCTNLTTISIPYTVTSIGDEAFKGCSNLNKVSLYAITTTIGTDAFTNCNQELEVTIMDTGNYTTVADDLFEGCSSLKRVVLGAGITAVGENAFKDCNNLSAVQLYTTMESFSPTALPNYRAIVIMATADDTIVDANAFKNCTGLYYVLLDDGVTALGASAFEGCTLLSTVYLPANLTSLPSSVFAGCTNLENIGYRSNNGQSYSIGLPATIQSIGESAFEGTGLKTIIIPESLTQIGQKAFAACSSLNKVTVESSTPPVLPDANVFDATTYESATLTIPLGSKIAYQQATGWKEFVSMKQQPGVVADNQGILYAYYPDDCYAVVTSYSGTATNIVIPETVTGIDGIVCTVTTIGNRAFASAAIESVFLPSTVTTIDVGAFASSNITEINIPASVKTIQMFAFDGCARLTKVKVNWTVATSTSSNTSSVFVHSEAFGYLTLGNITLLVPEGTMSIYNNVVPWKNFGNIVETYVYNGLVYTLIDGGQAMQVVGWLGTLPSTLNIPESITVDGTSYPVTTIADAAFLGNTDITNVTMEHVTTVGREAFAGCSNIGYVNMPSATSVAAKAFSGCSKSNLTVEISTALTDLALDAFENINTTNSLFNIVVPANDNTLTTIQANQFANQPWLTRVNLSKDITAIGVEAFMNCSRLTEVLVNNGVAQGCSLVTIGARAFQNSGYLRQFNLPESVTTIGNQAFQGTGFQSFIIPASVTSIGAASFANTPSMTNLSVATGNTIYDSRDGCNGIIRTADHTLIQAFPSTVIPSTVKNIEYAYYLCMDLESVAIPSSVTTLSSGAFQYSSLPNVTIPASVTSLQGSVFKGCDQLTAINVMSATPPTVSSDVAFGNDEGGKNIYQNATLYVPKGAKAAYQTADVWKNFARIEEIFEKKIDGRSIADVELTYNVTLPLSKDFDYAVVNFEGSATNAMCTAFQMEADDLWNGIVSYSGTQANGTIMNYAANADGTLQNAGPNSAEDFGHWFNAEGVVTDWSNDGSAIFTIFTKSKKNAHVGLRIDRNAVGNTRTIREALVYKDAEGKEAKVYFTFHITFTDEEGALPQSRLTSIDYRPECGDGNADGIGGIDINDVLAVIAYILGNDVPDTFNEAAADVNGDTHITIADAVTILNIILTNP